jgi:creatinine amidohydrolase
MAVHHLAALTWKDVGRLTAGRLVAILPAGAIEAHGPHLPLGTDVIIAEAMARDGAARLADQGIDVLVLPSLPFAPAPFGAAFPGTIDAPASATAAVVTAIVHDLARHGVQLTVLANAHHDPANVEALRAAAEVMDGTDGRPALVFPDLTRRRWAERLTDEFRSGACHAGRYETSILLAERPELVNQEVMAALPPNPRSLVDAMRDGRETFVDAGGAEAYFGWPAEASAAEGQMIVGVLGAILCEAVLEKL